MIEEKHNKYILNEKYDFQQKDKDVVKIINDEEEEYSIRCANHNNNQVSKGEEGNKYELNIKSVKQSSTWDCGLACVKMILTAYNTNFDNLDTICSALEVNTSVWSIDLCYMLKHYNIAHTFLTTTMGVDKSYVKEPFYEEYYQDDVSRVEHLFRQAKSVGLKIEKKTVSLGDIVRHLKSLRPIIILVDWSLIKSQHSTVFSCFRHFIKRRGKYQGHFIVLTGCTEDGKNIFYLNPEKSNRKSLSSQLLDEARKSYGTDQDILFITEKISKSFSKIAPGNGDT